MADKKTLSSLIGDQMDAPTPDNYPAAKKKAVAAPKKDAPPKRAAKAASSAKSAPKKAVAPAAGERRRSITADLTETQFRALRDMADDLQCSKVEILRSLINLAARDAALLNQVADELTSPDVHRPKGFAYLAAKAADIR